MELFEALGRHALGDRGEIGPAQDHARPGPTTFEPLAERHVEGEVSTGVKRKAAPPDALQASVGTRAAGPAPGWAEPDPFGQIEEPAQGPPVVAERLEVLSPPSLPRSAALPPASLVPTSKPESPQAPDPGSGEGDSMPGRGGDNCDLPKASLASGLAEAGRAPRRPDSSAPPAMPELPRVAHPDGASGSISADKGADCPVPARIQGAAEFRATAPKGPVSAPNRVPAHRPGPSEAPHDARRSALLQSGPDAERPVPDAGRAAAHLPAASDPPLDRPQTMISQLEADADAPVSAAGRAIAHPPVPGEALGDAQRTAQRSREFEPERPVSAAGRAAAHPTGSRHAQLDPRPLVLDASHAQAGPPSWSEAPLGTGLATPLKPGSEVEPPVATAGRAAAHQTGSRQALPGALQAPLTERVPDAKHNLPAASGAPSAPNEPPIDASSQRLKVAGPPIPPGPSAGETVLTPASIGPAAERVRISSPARVERLEGAGRWRGTNSSAPPAVPVDENPAVRSSLPARGVAADPALRASATVLPLADSAAIAAPAQSRSTATSAHSSPVGRPGAAPPDVVQRAVPPGSGPRIAMPGTISVLARDHRPADQALPAAAAATVSASPALADASAGLGNAADPGCDPIGPPAVSQAGEAARTAELAVSPTATLVRSVALQRRPRTPGGERAAQIEPSPAPITAPRGAPGGWPETHSGAAVRDLPADVNRPIETAGRDAEIVARAPLRSASPRAHQRAAAAVATPSVSIDVGTTGLAADASAADARARHMSGRAQTESGIPEASDAVVRTTADAVAGETAAELPFQITVGPAALEDNYRAPTLHAGDPDGRAGPEFPNLAALQRRAADRPDRQGAVRLGGAGTLLTHGPRQIVRQGPSGMPLFSAAEIADAAAPGLLGDIAPLPAAGETAPPADGLVGPGLTARPMQAPLAALVERVPDAEARDQSRPVMVSRALPVAIAKPDGAAWATASALPQPPIVAHQAADPVPRHPEPGLHYSGREAAPRADDPVGAAVTSPPMQAVPSVLQRSAEAAAVGRSLPDLVSPPVPAAKVRPGGAVPAAASRPPQVANVVEQAGGPTVPRREARFESSGGRAEILPPPASAHGRSGPAISSTELAVAGNPPDAGLVTPWSRNRVRPRGGFGGRTTPATQRLNGPEGQTRPEPHSVHDRLCSEPPPLRYRDPTPVDWSGPPFNDEAGPRAGSPAGRNDTVRPAIASQRAKPLAPTADGAPTSPEQAFDRTEERTASRNSHRRKIGPARAAVAQDARSGHAGPGSRPPAEAAALAAQVRVAQARATLPVSDARSRAIASGISAGSRPAVGGGRGVGESPAHKVAEQPADAGSLDAGPDGSPSIRAVSPARSDFSLRSALPAETSLLPAGTKTGRRARLAPAGGHPSAAGGDRQARETGADWPPSHATTAARFAAVAAGREFDPLDRPTPPRSGGGAAQHFESRSRARSGAPLAPVVVAARPSPSASTRPIAQPAEPASIAGRPGGGAPRRAAAIASYLDSHIPSAAASPRPRRFVGPDRSGAVRAQRDQVVPAPTVRVHIGHIRIEGAPAKARPRFARPRPSLGLADYIQRRQGR